MSSAPWLYLAAISHHSLLNSRLLQSRSSATSPAHPATATGADAGRLSSCTLQ